MVSGRVTPQKLAPCLPSGACDSGLHSDKLCLSCRSRPLLFTLVHRPSTRVSCTHWQDTGRWREGCFWLESAWGRRGLDRRGYPRPCLCHGRDRSPDLGHSRGPRCAGRPHCSKAVALRSSLGWQTQPQPGTLSFASCGLGWARSPREELGVAGTPLGLPFLESSEGSASCLTRGAEGGPSEGCASGHAPDT